MRNKFSGTGDGYHPLRKIRIALSGMKYAILLDFSVAYKVVISVAVLTIAFIFRAWVDFLVILLATGLMLTAELLNSAIEAICDLLVSGYNEKIKVIKDIAAAAAGISIVVWLVVLTVELSEILPVLTR
jgi:diacylglycerol kinase